MLLNNHLPKAYFPISVCVCVFPSNNEIHKSTIIVCLIRIRSAQLERPKTAPPPSSQSYAPGPLHQNRARYFIIARPYKITQAPPYPTSSEKRGAILCGFAKCLHLFSEILIFLFLNSNHDEK